MSVLDQSLHFGSVPRKMLSSALTNLRAILAAQVVRRPKHTPVHELALEQTGFRR
jgi:hypothetical protein